MNTTAVITDMSQPLAPVIGNALEVGEAGAYLTGQRQDPRLHQVVLALGSELLVTAGITPDQDQARRKLEKVLAEGSAAECFNKMVASLGGPSGFLEQTDQYLPKAPVIVEVSAKTSGVVSSINTRALGLALLRLGGGRQKPDDDVDPVVGFDQCRRVGEEVDRGSLLCRIHARDPDQAASVLSDVQRAIVVSDHTPKNSPVVVSVLEGT